MAWDEATKKLDHAIGLDIDGWYTITEPVRSSVLAWILEDRTYPASSKAERLIESVKESTP